MCTETRFERKTRSNIIPVLAVGNAAHQLLLSPNPKRKAFMVANQTNNNFFLMTGAQQPTVNGMQFNSTNTAPIFSDVLYGDLVKQAWWIKLISGGPNDFYVIDVVYEDE